MVAALARAVAAGPPDVPTPPAPVPAEAKAIEAATPIFLRTPADRDEFWKMLARPDFVILDGELYRKLRQGAEAARPRGPASPGVVGSVTVGGEVDGDRARLTVELRIGLDSDGPAWVPIRLDGLTLSEVREGDRDLPARAEEDRSWSVELAGRREHVVRVALIAPVRATAEGSRLEVAIPPAASNRLEIDVRQAVLSAVAGPDEPISVAPAEGQPGVVRLSGRLGPRSRLELSWRGPPAPDLKLAPLLSCQGEIAVEVEPGSIRIRSSWLVSAIRGTADRLTLRLDPAEEVVEVHVDDRPVPVETRREAGRLVLVVPLAEPVAATLTRALAISSRRAVATPGAARVVLQGYAFDGAKVQAGILAISRTGPLFLNPTPGRGLRRIDPRSDLPEGLRARQDIALAFEFHDQPFELQLGIDPAPPRLQIEARTALAIGPRSARVETQLDCRVAQGRPFEVRVSLPAGLEFEEAGPPELVATAQVLLDDPEAGPEVAPDRPRRLALTLNRQARESGKFVLRLRGRSALDPSRPVAVPLFQPPAEWSTGGRIEVAAERNVSVELDESGDDPPPFRREPGPMPDPMASPFSRSTGADAPLLALRYDSDPGSIPLRVAILPRTVRHESVLMATVDRKGAEVFEEVSVEVAHGGLTTLDLVVPREVPPDWDLEGVDRVARELLGRDADGSRRFRVRAARGESGSTRLRFRYRAPLLEASAPGRSALVRLAPIRVVEGASTSSLARIGAEAGVDVRASGPGWSAADAPSPTGSGPPILVALARVGEGGGPIEVEVRSSEAVPLPATIAPRLWLRTVQRADDDLATTAHYWLEIRGRWATLLLPPGSRWIRARAGGVDLGPGDVGRIGPDEYRVEFPNAVAPGPLLLGVEYLAPAAAANAAGGWPAPELRDGVVQQTSWEFHTTGTRAGVGVPRGWTDENEWFWDGLLWRRRPLRGPAELARWLSGGGAHDRLADAPDSGEPSGRHGYLFSRPGPPATLRFPVFSRLALLLVCSGPVLLAGLLALARRLPPRPSAAAALVVAFAIGAAFDPDATILILQSSALGFVLLMAAVGMNWLLDRRGGAGLARDRGPAEVVGLTITAPGQVGMIGPDESTAIRPRPSPTVASTADLILVKRPAGQAEEEEPMTTDLNLR